MAACKNGASANHAGLGVRSDQMTVPFGRELEYAVCGNVQNRRALAVCQSPHRELSVQGLLRSPQLRESVTDGVLHLQLAGTVTKHEAFGRGERAAQAAGVQQEAAGAYGEKPAGRTGAERDRPASLARRGACGSTRSLARRYRYGIAIGRLRGGDIYRCAERAQARDGQRRPGVREMWVRRQHLSLGIRLQAEQGSKRQET
jgi:hypothetical protein